MVKHCIAWRLSANLFDSKRSKLWIVVVRRRQCTKREVVLHSINAAVLLPLASLFTFGATERPSGLGVQVAFNGKSTVQMGVSNSVTEA